MKASLLIITSLSLLAASADARVGDTVKQAESRYGSPLRVLPERGTFREVGYDYRGFMTGVSYVSGIVKSEGFARLGGGRLSDAEVQQLLSISAAPGTSWKPAGDGFWVRSDGKVVALLHEHKFLQVQEKGFRQPTQ